MRLAWKLTLILLALAAFGGSLATAYAEGGKDIDLASCAWQASAGAHVKIQGDEIDLNVSLLPQPEPRTMECWVSLPGDQLMVVRGLHHGAVTERGWTFSFERTSGERRQLYRGSQERQFSFPVPAEWEHDKQIGIVIGIPGDNPGYLHLENLRLQPASAALPGSPEPISPTEGQQVTPPAGDFLWACPQPGSTVGYDLEWQREGEETRKAHIAAYFQSDAQGFWPSHWLSAGKYAWRVRALNPAGNLGSWSRMMHFTVRVEEAPQPPVVLLSPKRPLTILDLPIDDVKAAWGRIPAAVRPNLLFRTGGSRQYVASILKAAQAARVPIALQVNGPHDIIAGRWDRVPLALLAQWAREYPTLKAFYICEQQVQGGLENPEVTSYLERLIALGAELGRPVFWADANWGGNIWLEVEARQDFARFLRAHRGYVYPLWKMNGGFAPYLAPAGLLGLWLSHTVAAWGVQPESWYWTEAGFTTLGIQHDYKEGVRQDAPLVIFQELALLGATAGAQIYSFEPTGDFFGASSGQNLETIIIPLIRILSESVIPDRADVQAAIPRKHVLEPADLVFRPNYTPPIRDLFAHSLGIAYPFQMVPESGNCYWIPFMTGPVATGTKEGSSSEDSAAHPLHTCPPPVPGQAAVFKVGKTTFVFNSRVNWNEDEPFSIRLAGTLAKGKLGLNGWVAALDQNSEEAHLWFFARAGAHLVMDFDHPVLWRALAPQDKSLSTGGQQGDVSGVSSGTESSPVNRIDLAAGRQPWEVVIRRWPTPSSN